MNAKKFIEKWLNDELKADFQCLTDRERVEIHDALGEWCSTCGSLEPRYCVCFEPDRDW